MDSVKIRMIGEHRSDTGLGVAMRSFAKIFESLQIPQDLIVVDNACKILSETHAQPRPIELNLFYLNMEQVARTPRQRLEKALGDRYTIGHWYYEVDRLPDKFLPALDAVDEIWVATRYLQEMFERVTDKPVLVVPPILDVVPVSEPGTDLFGIPSNKFVYFFNFAVGSCATRKNPLAIIEAFRRAFADLPGHDAMLVFKTHDLGRFTELKERIQTGMREIGGKIIDESLPREQMMSLFQRCDVYVSLHRSEGLGLGMAEAMSLKKPVIATNYSGNADFLTPENSYPISYQLIKVQDTEFVGDGVFKETYAHPEGVWAAADIEEAARAIRRTYDERGEAAQKGEMGYADIHRLYSLETAKCTIDARLAEIVEKKLYLRKTKAGDQFETLLEKMRLMCEQYDEHYEKWLHYKTADQRLSAKIRIPLLGGIARIFIRVLMLGKLSDHQKQMHFFASEYRNYHQKAVKMLSQQEQSA